MKVTPEQALLDAAQELVRQRNETDAELKRLSNINNRAKEILEGKFPEVPTLVENPKRQIVDKKEKRRRKGVVLGFTTWAFVIGLLIGGSAIPQINDDPVIQENYSECISQARYSDPIENNQYQELVNALYACEIYGAD